MIAIYLIEDGLDRLGLLLFLYFLFAAIPVSILAYVVCVFLGFAVRLLFSGFKERRLEPICGSLWIFISVVMYLLM